MATSASLLALVDSAIEAILVRGADSYSIGSRSYTALDVDKLLAWREKLQAAVSNEAGGTFRKAVIRRPSP